MKRKLTILVTAMFVLLTLSALVIPLRAVKATYNIVQEKSSFDTSLNKDSLNYQIDEMLDSGRLVFLYFFKEGCYACRLQKPILEELEQEYSSDVVFIGVNGLEDRKAMADFGVRGFPTMFLISGKNAEGYEYVDFTGYTGKSMLKTNIDSLLSPVAESIDTLESAGLSYEMAVGASVEEHEMTGETELGNIVPTEVLSNSSIAPGEPSEEEVVVPEGVVGSSEDVVAPISVEPHEYHPSGATAEVALFKDSNPWGYTAIEDLLIAYGISYDVYTSADMGIVDLSPYDKVITASVQGNAFWSALEANKEWFEKYAKNGGVLEMHLAAYTGSNSPGKVYPGGFVYYHTGINEVSIVDSTHRVLKIPNIISDAALDNWNFSAHGWFSAIPGGANEVLEATVNGNPVFADYAFGSGIIFATTQTVEWIAGHGYPEFLENMILYTLPAEVALFKDSNPWGYTAIEDLLKTNYISYDIYTSADMGVVNLSPYNKVITASVQSNAFWNALEANKEWFENYANNGGILEMHLCAQQYQGSEGKIFPGDFVFEYSLIDEVSIVDPLYPVLNIPNLISDAALDGWYYSTHGWLSKIPVGANEVLEDTVNGYPVFAEVKFGSGIIFATTQTVEWIAGHGYPEFLENMILHPVPTKTYYCWTCDECNKALAAASPGDTVRLMADIKNHIGSCIIIRNSRVIFDGNGHIIDGDGVDKDYGVGVFGRPYNGIINCKISDFYYGIYLLDRADNTRVIDNHVSSPELVKVPNSYGIYIEGCNEVLVWDNVVYYNKVLGIYVEGGGGNSIERNDVRYNTWDGIYLYRSILNTIEENIARSNDRRGIMLYWDSDNNTIRHNRVYSNTEDGIYLWGTNFNAIEDNYITYNLHGIYLRDSNDTMIARNTANYNNYGIFLFYSYGNEVTDNTANYNKKDSTGCGIHSEYGTNNIMSNTVNYNYNGICLYEDTGDIIAYNTVLHNDYIGLFIEACYENIVGFNTISYNYFGIRVLNSESIWIGWIFILPIPNTVENNEWIGISVGNSKQSIIAASKVNFNYHGIYLWGNSDENVIGLNQIIHNDQGYGVYFASTSNNNTLTSNVICQNLIDINDLDANSGDDNTCNTPGGWNDDGTTGCTYSCPQGFCWDYTTSEWVGVPATGNWQIATGHVVECNDTEITLNGNLEINGTLIFNHVKLMMNVINMEYFGNIYRIEVNSGGGFYINSKDGLPSIITNGLNATARYNFKVKSGSTFEMRDSELHKCGWAWNPPPTDDLDLAGLWIATDSVTIENSIFTDNYAGIIFYNSGNHGIFNNFISSSDSFGIYGLNSPNNVIEYNEFTNNGWNWYALEGGGILLTGASNSLITHNTLFNNKQGSGIALYNAQDSTITNNEANSNSWSGISLSGALNCLVANNTANSNGRYGISLSGAENSIVTSNMANSNGWHGFLISGALNSIVTNNMANSNGWNGISLSGANSLIAGNLAEHNDFGIHVYSSINITIADNDAHFNTGGWPILESSGIFLDSCQPLSAADRNIIVNNRVTGNPNGILVEASRYATVTDNFATSNIVGIYLLNSYLVEVSYNNASNNPGGTGIKLSGSNNNTIFENLAESNFNGIYLHGSSYNDIFNNWARFNNFGISLRRSSNYNEVIDNDASLCTEYAAYLYRAYNNLLEQNDFYLSGGTGIYLERSDGNKLMNNDAIQAVNYGINLLESHENLIDLNDVRFSGDIGIELSSSNYNNLTHNAAEGSTIGISIRFSLYNKVQENIVVGNDIGIYLIRSDHTTILMNDASSNNNVGIDLSLSDFNHIAGNVVNENPNYGIHLYSSEENIIEENQVNLNGIGIYLDWSVNNIIIGNTVTHNEFVGIALFWLSDHNEVLFNQAHSNMNISIRISSSNFNYVEGNNASLSGVGIFLDWSENNVIINNNADSNAYHGITLEWFSNNNEVTHNSVTGGLNSSLIGISLDMSSNNIISYNNASLNKIGISLEWSSNNNTVIFNIMCYNEYHGLSFNWESNYNLVRNNTIGYNLEYGVYMYESANNTIYHNDIVFNGVAQAFDNARAGVNAWDNGYPTGGNYWSDYGGVDLYSGPYQNETGSDGIGDTPYDIDIESQDHYPLMFPGAVTLHDVAIVNIVISKTIVGQGQSMFINVTVRNQGTTTETFDVTTYANTTIIDTQTIILTSGNSTTITINWDTTSVTIGNYTISAHATPVPGEMYTANNVLINSWVVVTIAGDINGDFKVDHKDLLWLASAYGSEVGDPNYNPEADLNNDGKIDHKDLLILAANFGKKYP